MLDDDKRGALKSLLRHDGILYAAPGQPVVDRWGMSAPWMFYSWNITLTAEGARLAAGGVVERLRAFRSTQLATYGATAVPLLTACVMVGGGRFTGLCLRETPKGGPDGRQIEGPVDPSRPVVLIDDSLSSGRSLLEGARLLETHGLEVEGAICLVHFPNRGGAERLRGLGYRVETLFDIWTDLEMPRPVYVPGWRRAGELEWDRSCLEQGLHPAAAARLVAQSLVTTGLVPRPPASFDQVYDGGGGVWVSLRSRSTDLRLAREGFWHFDPSDADPCRDVVLATAKTIRSAGITQEQLGQVKIAVTFFGSLQAIQPSGLDFSRYGIVVQSRSWETKVGGALPNTEVFTSEQEQYSLALSNAGIGPFEPRTLYRHTVQKCVEPGETWLPYGAPDGPGYAWTRDPAVGCALTERARQAAVACCRGEPLAGPPVDAGLVPGFAGIAVTLYRQGVVGCAISARKNLDAAVVAATQAAVEDERFVSGTPSRSGDDLVPAVAVLHDPEWLGYVSVEKAARKLRLGLDSISAQDGDRGAVFLDAVAPHYNWGKEKVAERLLRKAGIEGQDAHWTTYRTATWLYGPTGPRRQVFGFVEEPDIPLDIDAVRAEIDLLAAHIASNVEPTGLPLYAQDPITGSRWPSGSAARLIHALGAIEEAGLLSDRPDWVAIARDGLAHCLAAVQAVPDTGCCTLALSGHRCGPMADCELLAVASSGTAGDGHATSLAGLCCRIRDLLRPDGTVAPPAQHVKAERDNDFLPGAVILALAAWARNRGAGAIDLGGLEAVCAWQLERVRGLHRWGQVGWLPQAWSAMWRATGDARFLDMVFEVVDWCLEHQVEATGAFLADDLNPSGPSFHTAFIAEAVADAWELALVRGDHRRAKTYEASWLMAFRFLRRLVVRRADAPCLADPLRSIGGVRGTLDTSYVRVDYVSHMLVALCKGLRQLEATA